MRKKTLENHLRGHCREPRLSTCWFVTIAAAAAAPSIFPIVRSSLPDFLS